MFPGARDQDLDPSDLPTRLRRHADALEQHARSPLSVRLMRAAADDLARGGVTAAVFDDLPLPPGQVPALRLLAGLHRLVLCGSAPELAAYYPSAGGDRPPDGVWPAAEAAIRRHLGAVRAVASRGVQTNEPGRSAVLYGVLLWAARVHRLPVRLLEVGASAGLNLQVDRYAYRIAGRWLGDPGSPLRIDEPWRGAPVPAPGAAAAALRIVARAGCDLHPIDVTTPDGRLDVVCYIWPDETARIARLQAALEVAARHPVPVTRAAAHRWLAGLLEQPAPDADQVTVIWQSVVEQYLPAADRDALAGVVEEAAAVGADGAGRRRDRRLPGDGPVLAIRRAGHVGRGG